MMISPYQVNINLDGILKKLFLVYAFSLPFELAFEILFDIDTIFKPFRIFSLIIIGVFFIRILKKRLNLNAKDKTDLLLYAVFIYGILISFVQIIGGVFNFGLFYNDLFQFGLHIASFFIFKAIPYSQKQMIFLFKCFFTGILINASYIFSEFVLLGHHGRQAGFTDNPNYGSLGLVAGIVFLMLKINYIRRFWKQILYVILTLFLIYIFIIEGSRTGLVMLIIANFFLFFFYSFRKKLMLLLLSGLIVLLLIPQESGKVTVGGGPLILVTRVMYDIENREEDVRFVVWRGVFRALEDAGYMGMGIGQFKAKFSKYYGEESNQLILKMANRGYFLSTHNDYLAILTDYGLPSLLFYIAYLFFTFKKVTRRMLYPVEDQESQMLHRLAFILFCCLIVFGIAAENFQHPLFWFLLAFSTKNFIGKQSVMELNT